MPRLALFLRDGTRKLPEIRRDNVYELFIKASATDSKIWTGEKKGDVEKSEPRWHMKMKNFKAVFDSKPVLYIEGTRAQEFKPKSIYRILMRTDPGKSEIFLKPDKRKDYEKVFTGNMTRLDIFVAEPISPVPGETDRFGVLKIYPDASSRGVIYQGGNGWDRPEFSNHGYESLPNSVRIKRKTFSFHTGQRALNKNIEVTGYIKVPRLNREYGRYDGVGHCKSGSGLSLKLRGSHHKSRPRNDPSSSKCYIFHFEYEGGNCNNFQKEYPHPNYAKHKVNASFTASNWVGRWVGFKGITVNEGNNSVRCDAYIDYGGIRDGRPANRWKKWYSVLDRGQFGDDNHTRSPFTEGHGNYIEFRMDNAPNNTEMKFASVRQIQKRR